mmetsp:Transcript_69260/g.186606  ORF Transcript_69260/g.186606 Transcript_69260/m.186606 type:complete len:317 (-) Transcript_69260:7-957(-)
MVLVLACEKQPCRCRGEVQNGEPSTKWNDRRDGLVCCELPDSASGGCHHRPTGEEDLQRHRRGPRGPRGVVPTVGRQLRGRARAARAGREGADHSAVNLDFGRRHHFGDADIGRHTHHLRRPGQPRDHQAACGQERGLGVGSGIEGRPGSRGSHQRLQHPTGRGRHLPARLRGAWRARRVAGAAAAGHGEARRDLQREGVLAILPRQKHEELIWRRDRGSSGGIRPRFSRIRPLTTTFGNTKSFGDESEAPEDLRVRSLKASFGGESEALDEFLRVRSLKLLRHGERGLEAVSRLVGGFACARAPPPLCAAGISEP